MEIYLLKISRDLQMLFAPVTHLVEGLSLETLLALKMENNNNDNNNNIIIIIIIPIMLFL
jgi:hypothetical protein